jgi:hypothetical protein
MFRRMTDDEIHRRLRKRPLEVGANLIARTAHSALKLLGEIRERTGLAIPLAWAPVEALPYRAIEVYPAATRSSGAAQGHRERAVDWVTLGQDRFFRFWSDARQEARGAVQGPAWHSYYLEELAPSYFLSNTVVELDGTLSPQMQTLWFPVAGTKESMRRFSIGLRDHVAQPLSPLSQP